MIPLQKLVEKAFDDNKCKVDAFSRIAKAFKAERDAAIFFYEYSEIDRVDNIDYYKLDCPARPRNGFWSWTTEEQYLPQDHKIIDGEIVKDVVEKSPVNVSEQKMK